MYLELFIYSFIYIILGLKQRKYLFNFANSFVRTYEHFKIEKPKQNSYGQKENKKKK
jgi:hypothetical protein